MKEEKRAGELLGIDFPATRGLSPGEVKEE